MSNATCPNCGATLVAGAKFCRQCGRLVNTGAGASSVTEATTRTLRTPAEYGAQPTDFFAPQPTSPAYLAPGVTPQPPAYTTSSLEPKGQQGQQRKVWLLGLIAALCFLALIAVGIIAFIRSQPAASQPPTATVPQPPAISVPPPPPPPTTGTASLNNYIYPGAETRMRMTQANGENFVQLHTNDSFEKVFEWYRTRLNPENVFKANDTNAVLKSKAKDLMAVINGTGAGTDIILKQGDEMNFDGDQ